MDVLNELLYSGQVSFAITTTMVTQKNMFLTQISNDHFGIFFAIASSEHVSREKCVLQVFDCLNKINDIVNGYRIGMSVFVHWCDF